MDPTTGCRHVLDAIEESYEDLGWSPVSTAVLVDNPRAASVDVTDARTEWPARGPFTRLRETLKPESPNTTLSRLPHRKP
jgi:hypothetical protein